MNNVLTIILFISFLSCSSNGQNQQKLNERLFRNLNEIEEFKDYRKGSGAVIDKNFEYGISSYQNMKIETTQLIVFEKIHNDNNPTKYSIIDTLLFENMPVNHYFGYQLCRLNGEVDSEIIVLYENEEDVEFYTKIKKAWRASIKLNKIIEIETEGIDYYNEGYGV